VPPSGNVLYLDSSALVKLVVREGETRHLLAFLKGRPQRVSSELARVEVVRAVRGNGPPAVRRARRLLQRMRLIRLDTALLDAAAEIDPLVLRSLDAFHLASAQALGSALGEVVTYDVRLADAARALGLTVAAPS
jgi:predicted nucleic acid-binding protein